MAKRPEIFDELDRIAPLIPTPIYWLDTNYVIIGGNNLCLSAIGSKEKNINDVLIGKTYYDYYPKDIADELTKMIKIVLDTNQTTKVEEKITDVSTGKYRYYETARAPLYDNAGRVVGTICSAIEITDKKETDRLTIENTKQKADLKIAQIIIEKEQEMRKTVMVLVGDIVHDLYTPLAIIDDGASILESIASGLRELIKEAHDLKSEKLDLINKKKLNYIINEMPAAQKDSIRMINEFIDTTIRELLVTQKYEDGAIAREELTKCSSRRVLENVLDSYPLHEGIIINQSFSYDFFFMGNSILMMKVLFNLIRNAEDQIIANDKGEITITTEGTDNNNLLIVKDTAGGAPPEVVTNVFKEFFTTKKDGSGIGLAFCKKMMQNFGGDLICRSSYGESIEFILSFPKIDEIQS